MTTGSTSACDEPPAIAAEADLDATTLVSSDGERSNHPNAAFNDGGMYVVITREPKSEAVWRESLENIFERVIDVSLGVFVLLGGILVQEAGRRLREALEPERCFLLAEMKSLRDIYIWTSAADEGNSGIPALEMSIFHRRH